MAALQWFESLDDGTAYTSFDSFRTIQDAHVLLLRSKYQACPSCRPQNLNLTGNMTRSSPLLNNCDDPPRAGGIVIAPSLPHQRSRSGVIPITRHSNNSDRRHKQ